MALTGGAMRRTRITVPAQPHDARAEARARMLAARDQVRSWFTPESRVALDLDVAEVVGERGQPND